MISSSKNKFPDWLPFVEKVTRAPAEVSYGVARGIDAQVVVQRGHYVLVVDWPIGNFRSGFVRCPDDLANLHASAGHNPHGGFGPMVSPSLCIDFGGSPKLTPGQYRDVIQHAAFLQIRDQGPEGMIQYGAEVAHARKVVGVCIEIAQ